MPTGVNTGIFAVGMAPIVLYVKNVTVLTTGSPADIATIPVPTGITRFRVISGSAASNSPGTYVQETASATNGAATFQAWSAAGGTGTQIMGNRLGSASAPLMASWIGSSMDSIAPLTTSTIYIRQTVDSANSGTASFYITIYPLP